MIDWAYERDDVPEYERNVWVWASCHPCYGDPLPRVGMGYLDETGKWCHVEHECDPIVIAWSEIEYPAGPSEREETDSKDVRCGHDYEPVLGDSTVRCRHCGAYEWRYNLDVRQYSLSPKQMNCTHAIWTQDNGWRVKCLTCGAFAVIGGGH